MMVVASLILISQQRHFNMYRNAKMLHSLPLVGTRVKIEGHLPPHAQMTDALLFFLWYEMSGLESM